MVKQKQESIRVDRLITMANTVLKLSDNDYALQRKGIASFLLGILGETGNYQGFTFLDSETDQSGTRCQGLSCYGRDGRVHFRETSQ